MTICMLLRLGFIFHIRRFGGAGIQALAVDFNFTQEAACRGLFRFSIQYRELSKLFFGFLPIILGYRK